MAIKQNPRIAQAARAAISLAVGLFLTFSQSHGAEIGLVALGIFGLGFAVLNGFASVIFQKGLSAIENVPLTMVALLIGIFALMAPNSISGAIETTVWPSSFWSPDGESSPAHSSSTSHVVLALGRQPVATC
jgi:hypothetical protein